MKKLVALFLLCLVASIAYGQSTFTIKPTVDPSTLTCATTIGSDTVTSNKLFGGVTAGIRIIGDDIPFGSTVISKIDSSTIIISNDADSTHASVALQLGVFQSHAYAAGDAMGFPFAIPTMRNLKQIVVIDDAKQITSVDIVFFNNTFVETADSAAFAISDADAEKLVGYITVGGTGANKALANNTVMVLPFTTLPPQFSNTGKMYAQLIAVGTPTFTAIDNLTIKFIYE